MMPTWMDTKQRKPFELLGIERLDAVRIPIIALSANAFIDDIQESLDSGMNDHISKPINMEELTDTIAKYIKRDTCLAKELKQNKMTDKCRSIRKIASLQGLYKATIEVKDCRCKSSPSWGCLPL